ncbi:hypothetical protein C8Q78DRAFT_1063181 [Trametes maxima]|nr:hypothetical protein C8Q78DRAFT_1063181 [Trametes maxima]
MQASARFPALVLAVVSVATTGLASAMLVSAVRPALPVTTACIPRTLTPRPGHRLTDRDAPLQPRRDAALAGDDRRRTHVHRRAALALAHHTPRHLQPAPGRGAAQDLIVTYCSHPNATACRGPCTVYNGWAAGAKCLDAPDTNCLTATQDVGFCRGARCNGCCSHFDACVVHLADGFCFTPGTRSMIVIPGLDT